jgi:hypothetical protein
MAKWASDVTSGMFWVGINIAFAGMIFMATQRFGTPRSYGFASLCGLLGAIFFAIMRFMPWWVASLFILNGAIGFVVMIMSER